MSEEIRDNAQENYQEKDDELRVPLTVSKFLLKEGDILDEDLLYYDNLKKGTLLTKSIINIIQNLDLVENVRVLRLKKIVDLEEKEKNKNVEVLSQTQTILQSETVENISDTDIKLGFNDEKTDKKIAELIRNTLNKIRGENYEEKLENTKEEINNLIIQDQITSTTMKQEVQKTIHEISQSFVDTMALQNVKPIQQKTEVIALNFSNKSISNYFLDLTISDKVQFTNSAKSVVVKFINSFGDDNSGIILSSLLQFTDNDDYVVSHSIFVMAISIIIAKELTKLVYEKILSKKNEKVDPKSLKVISLKTFDLTDLTNIGMACLLHDIGLRKNFGVFPPTFKFSKLSYSKIELHPSESSFFVQRLNLDVSIQRAVYEHHEFLDGSGYPKGITRYMSKYSPIISFAERLSELVLENPFISRPIPPALAINHILKNELRKYDKDIIFAFIRATSTYPIGSWVELSNGLIGFVKDLSKKDNTKQIIKAIFSNQLQKLQSPIIIDLSENPEIKITKILNPIELSQKVGDIRTYYFD